MKSMISSSYSALLLSVSALFLVVLLSSCKKCNESVRVFGDLELQDTALEIEGVVGPDVLVFIDSNEREFIVERTNMTSMFKRIESGPFACEGDGISEGYYFAEERTSVFSGEDIQIIISLKALSDELSRNERELDLDKTIGQDYMEVRVIISECDTLYSLRAIQERGTNEPTIQSSLFPFRKFGQIHRNPFRLRNFSYEGEMVFTKERGLVSFNYCGLNWVQVAD